MSPLLLGSPPDAADWAAHTPTSDPGDFAALVEAVSPSPERIGEVARNLIAHYRAQASALPADTRADVHLRWVSDQLATDQQRHRCALDVARPLGERLQGCCRDHTLFAVAVLRQHGVPARSRVGFAGYLEPGWHHDHVVAEYRDGDRWRRFDPEIDPAPRMLPDPLDLQVGEQAPFQTAAEVFKLMRSGDIDPTIYGVAPGHPSSGEQFVVGEVFYEVAHRYGDEVLLWDGWGAIPLPGRPVEAEVLKLVDEVASLLLAADVGDVQAEAKLYRRYRDDDRLHPADSVCRFSPFGEPPVQVALRF
jgi:Transglutaminase-like superfamily